MFLEIPIFGRAGMDFPVPNSKYLKLESQEHIISETFNGMVTKNAKKQTVYTFKRKPILHKKLSTNR